MNEVTLNGKKYIVEPAGGDVVYALLGPKGRKVTGSRNVYSGLVHVFATVGGRPLFLGVMSDDGGQWRQVA